MFDFLEKTRQRPEHHRKVIALGISAIFIFFVFIGWSATLDLSLDRSGGGTLAGNSASTTQTASSMSPFNSIKESITATIIDFKDRLDFSKNETEVVVDKEHNPVPGLIVNPQDIK